MCNNTKREYIETGFINNVYTITVFFIRFLYIPFIIIHLVFLTLTFLSFNELWIDVHCNFIGLMGCYDRERCFIDMCGNHRDA